MRRFAEFTEYKTDTKMSFDVDRIYGISEATEHTEDGLIKLDNVVAVYIKDYPGSVLFVVADYEAFKKDLADHG